MSGVAMIGGALLAMRDLLLPRRCLACEAPLGGGWPRPVCDPCLEDFEALSFEGIPVCPRCGIPTGPAGAADTRCGTCVPGSLAYAFDGARSFGKHGGRLRDAILRFKFAPDPHLARPLAALVARAAARLPAANVVVAVPLHPKRLRERGFNQAAFLAREAAGMLEVPFARGALSRIVATEAQTRRAARARRAALAGTIAADPRAIRGARVLLVDDVMTTGATAAECARALRDAEAASVHVVTVARATLDAGAIAAA